METELWISGVHFPQFSARGCVQELWPVMDDRLFQRTINGTLLFLGHDSDVKYRTIITCHDYAFPVIGHISKGEMVHVGCLHTISQPIMNGRTRFCRPFIEGSVSVFGQDHVEVPFTVVKGDQGGDIISESGVYAKFRPILCMRVLDFRLTHHEWGDKNGWSITLEEV